MSGFGPPDGEPTLGEIEQEDAAQLAANLARCRQENEKLQAEVERLKQELIEVLDESMRNIANFNKDGSRAGWWDTMALSVACEIGDRLVELGTWKRHADGCGRRWFYRPVEGD